MIIIMILFISLRLYSRSSIDQKVVCCLSINTENFWDLMNCRTIKELLLLLFVTLLLDESFQRGDPFVILLHSFEQEFQIANIFTVIL